MLDSDFAIERPRRVYRRGIHLFKGSSHGAHSHKSDNPRDNAIAGHDEEVDPDNMLDREMLVQSGEGKGNNAQNMQDDEEHHASQHTFFISNSQRKLKLVARNAVSFFYSSHGAGQSDSVATNAPIHRFYGEDRGAMCMDRTESF